MQCPFFYIDTLYRFFYWSRFSSLDIETKQNKTKNIGREAFSFSSNVNTIHSFLEMDNNITMTKEEEFIIECITKYVVPIMFSIIVLTGSIGNILVIYVVSFHFKNNHY